MSSSAEPLSLAVVSADGRSAGRAHPDGMKWSYVTRRAIARALLRDAPIVLLDEPTSELDAEAEQAVLRALRRLMRGRTVLMVTHRPALLDLADRIVELRDGRLVTPTPPEKVCTGLSSLKAG